VSQKRDVRVVGMGHALAELIPTFGARDNTVHLALSSQLYKPTGGADPGPQPAPWPASRGGSKVFCAIEKRPTRASAADQGSARPTASEVP